MESPFTALEWTPDCVARFWDYWSRRADTRHTYFAFQVGAGVARFLERSVDLQGAAVLDFGAGPGHFLEHLLKRGARVSAVDYSPETVQQLEEKLKDRSGWTGAAMFDGRRLPYADATFDVVCCLETIEHLLDEHCDLIFRELRRVLKPGGTALFTTPNDENLSEQQLFCPKCSCTYHRWQHVRSWSSQTLNDCLIKHGYQVAFCEGLSFQSLQRKRLFRPHWLLWWSALEAIGILKRRRLANGSFFPEQLYHYGREHLAAVAVKSAAEARSDRLEQKPVAA
jgi:2-polyprenyl-3-methyl-5-hydroxy-6-metoxy-1,4-benzoquinol methylase